MPYTADYIIPQKNFKIYTYFLLGALYLLGTHAFSQDTRVFPLEWSNPFITTGQYNPAFISSENNIEVNASRRYYFSPLNEISTNWLMVTGRLNPKSARVKQYVGLQFYSDKEGDPIRRTRWYGQYAVEIPLSSFTSIRAGMAFGIINYLFSGTTQGTSGSDAALDYQTGLVLRHKKHYIGLSGLQLNNQSIQPINETFLLKRFYSCVIGTSLTVHPNWDIEPRINALLYPDAQRFHFSAQAKYFKDTFIFGSSVKTEQGLSFFAGTGRIEFDRYKIQLMLSYFYPTFGKPKGLTDHIEIGLTLLKKEKKTLAASVE